MATTFVGTFSGGLSASYAKSTDLTSALEAINFTFSSSYTSGQGANQANAFFSDTRTLAATNESFDLNAGTMTDVYGAGLVFTKVRLLYVKNKSTTDLQFLTLTGDFLSGAASSPLAGSTSPTININAGGFCLLESPPTTGFAVTTTVSDGLTVTNTASFDYDIIIVGVI